jgi:hypothetical protein
MKRAFAPLAFLLALAACHSQPTAGGLTADDERALDNAAAMLDQQNVFDTSPDGLAANQAEIEAQDNAAGGGAANRAGSQ